jgi:hypothetical protein
MEHEQTKSVATKSEEHELMDDDDSHFDDLPYNLKQFEESSRLEKFDHGYVAELMDKDAQLKKAQS